MEEDLQASFVDCSQSVSSLSCSLVFCFLDDCELFRDCSLSILVSFFRGCFKVARNVGRMAIIRSLFPFSELISTVQTTVLKRRHRQQKIKIDGFQLQSDVVDSIALFGR